MGTGPIVVKAIEMTIEWDDRTGQFLHFANFVTLQLVSQFVLFFVSCGSVLHKCSNWKRPGAQLPQVRVHLKNLGFDGPSQIF